MIRQPFDRNKHVYHNEAFVELVKDAVRFFNGTPVHELPPPEKFLGAGVYALYYTGDNPLYTRYKELNRLSYDFLQDESLEEIPFGFAYLSDIIQSRPKDKVFHCVSLHGDPKTKRL